MSRIGATIQITMKCPECFGLCSLLIREDLTVTQIPEWKPIAKNGAVRCKKCKIEICSIETLDGDDTENA